jgi:hypothetical protein
LPSKSHDIGNFHINNYVIFRNVGMLNLLFKLKNFFGRKIFNLEESYSICGKSNISPCKDIIFKKSSTRNQNPSRYYNSTTNLKCQQKPKLSSSFKNPHINIDLLLLPRGL